MLPHVTWVLLADGTQARILENRGRGTGLAPVPGMTFSAPHGKAQDIMADRPGRAFSSSGQGRSAMEMPTDPVEELETRFVRELAGVLVDGRRKNAYRDLIVAAAPRALGHLRQFLTREVEESIKSEMPVDLVNIPDSELPSHFKDILPL